jgi:hypothetical protein
MCPPVSQKTYADFNYCNVGGVGILSIDDNLTVGIEYWIDPIEETDSEMEYDEWRFQVRWGRPDRWKLKKVDSGDWEWFWNPCVDDCRYYREEVGKLVNKRDVGSPLIVTEVGEYDGNEEPILETHTFEFTPPDLTRSNHLTTRYLWIEIERYRNGNHIITDDKTKHGDICVNTEYGEGSIEDCSIRLYCGNYRYGRMNETLDYPIAYPLIVQVVNTAYNNDSPVDGIDVTFAISPGSQYAAHFKDGEGNHVSSITVKSQQGVQIGPDNIECKETVSGAAVCPLILDASGDIEVTASLSLTKVVTFNLVCLSNSEEDETAYDPNLVHEYCNGSIIPGDGLWGDCYDFEGSAPDIDPNSNLKSLVLEIDYIADAGLGPNQNIHLTEEDMGLIYQKVWYILTDAQIDLADNPLINPDDPRQPGSVIQAMDKEPHWEDALIRPGDPNSPKLKDVIYKSSYSKDDFYHHILPQTRGVFGREEYYTNPSRKLGKWERTRIHVVLLPGISSDKPKAAGFVVNGTTSPAYCASGPGPNPIYPDVPHAFPWIEYNPTTSETNIDAHGICIFTGNLKEITLYEGSGQNLDEVDWSWVCTDVHPSGNPASPYCTVLANVIAHEIGHAIGLDDEYDEEYKNQLMYGEIDVLSPLEDPRINDIGDENKNQHDFINLRKVLGREVVNSQW